MMTIVLLFYVLQWLLRSIWLWLLDLKAWCAANRKPIVVGVTTVGVLMWLFDLWDRQPEKAVMVVGVIVGAIVGVLFIRALLWLLHLVWLWLLKLIEDLKTWCAANQGPIVVVVTTVGVSMWLFGEIAGVFVSAAGVSLWFYHPRERQEHNSQYEPTINSRQVGSDYRSGTRQGEIRYSNPQNNHDHTKYRHATQEDAEKEVARMQQSGYDGSERLQVYYNKELGSWFTGKSKR